MEHHVISLRQVTRLVVTKIQSTSKRLFASMWHSLVSVITKLLCCHYFSSSSVVSHTFNALCVYCFFCDLHWWASPWRKIAYSITHSPSLFDVLGTKALALQNNRGSCSLVKCSLVSLHIRFSRRQIMYKAAHYNSTDTLTTATHIQQQLSHGLHTLFKQWHMLLNFLCQICLRCIRMSFDVVHNPRNALCLT